MDNKKIVSTFIFFWLKYPQNERPSLITLTCIELGITREQLFEALTDASL